VGAIDQVEGIAANSVPFVSIIIPCRNDGTFIAECLDSVIAARYPRDRLEVLVIDGMSEDGTHDIIKHRIKGYGFVRLLSNPRRITPAALNLGIFQSKGDIIVRIDAHSRISPSYITQCVAALEFSPSNAIPCPSTSPSIAESSQNVVAPPRRLRRRFALECA
jgi:glycosyltransferase involved in cell wall biosynthesis